MPKVDWALPGQSYGNFSKNRTSPKQEHGPKMWQFLIWSQMAHATTCHNKWSTCHMTSTCHKWPQLRHAPRPPRQSRRRARNGWDLICSVCSGGARSARSAPGAAGRSVRSVRATGEDIHWRILLQLQHIQHIQHTSTYRKNAAVTLPLCLLC